MENYRCCVGGGREAAGNSWDLLGCRDAGQSCQLLPHTQEGSSIAENDDLGGKTGIIYAGARGLLKFKRNMIEIK